MKMKVSILVIFSVIFLVGQSRTQDIENGGETSDTKISQIDLLAKAKEYMGVNILRDYSKDYITEPQLVRLSDQQDSTPFLHDYIVNRDIWEVSFKNVDIPYKGLGNNRNNELKRDFSIYLDPQSGKMLKIVANIIENEWEYRPGGSAKAKEKIWSNSGIIFTLPDKISAPFTTILSNCGHTPYKAAEIEAIFIQMKYEDGREPEDKWLITLKGIPPIPMFGHSQQDSSEIDDGSAKYRSTILIFADPITGEAMGTVVPAG